MEMPFIQQALVELYECKPEKLTDKKLFRDYLAAICRTICMKPVGKPVVIYNPGSKGISSGQIIETSHVIAHSYPAYMFVLVDITSCTKFDARQAAQFSRDYFEAAAYRLPSRGHGTSRIRL